MSQHGRSGHLAAARLAGHPESVDEEMGIYRDEVRDIFKALMDVKQGVNRIVSYIEDEDDGEEEETEDLPDA